MRLRRRLPAVLSAVALSRWRADPRDREERWQRGQTIRGGYGVADATWNVGAAAGQYSDLNSSLAENVGGGGEVDPHAHSRAKEKSYGNHSRLSVRAIVVEGLDGERVALLKSDNYLAQDLLLRRAGQLLAAGRQRGRLRGHPAHRLAQPLVAVLHDHLAGRVHLPGRLRPADVRVPGAGHPRRRRRGREGPAAREDGGDDRRVQRDEGQRGRSRHR
jgi:hypothetical protein